MFRRDREQAGTFKIIGGIAWRSVHAVRDGTDHIRIEQSNAHLTEQVENRMIAPRDQGEDAPLAPGVGKGHFDMEPRIDRLDRVYLLIQRCCIGRDSNAEEEARGLAVAELRRLPEGRALPVRAVKTAASIQGAAGQDILWRKRGSGTTR